MAKTSGPEFKVVIGFNVPDGEGGERRYDAGTDKKPNLVDAADFDADDWKALVKAGAVVKLLEAMSKAELVAEAQKLGAHVTPDSMTNEQIIKAIEKAVAGDLENQDEDA